MRHGYMVVPSGLVELFEYARTRLAGCVPMRMIFDSVLRPRNREWLRQR